jgi:ribosomal protein S20
MRLIDLIEEKDEDITYRDTNGKTKTIKLSSAITYPKTHPAYKMAISLMKTKSGNKPATTNKKPNVKNKIAKSDFKTSAEKSKKSIQQDKPIFKTIVSHEKDPDDIRNAIINKGKSGISDKAYSSLLNTQKDYWKNSLKDKKFIEDVSDWRDSGIREGRLAIDEFIQKNPPPPLKMKSPVWRGMGMAPKMYDKFMKMLDGKSEIKLPSMSYSFDVNAAVEFADADHQVIMNLKSECNELNAIALSDLPGQESVYSDKEKELITPSNATYKIESVKTVEFDYSPDKITMVNLIQKCGIDESVDTFADFSKDEFMDSLLGPTQKPS